MKNRSISTKTKGTNFRPRISMMAALVAACLSGEAAALGFGRMSVQSALGQPLRAQVELTDVKAANVRAGMAPASVYAQKGVDYNPAVRGIRASVRKLPNGRTVLVLSSDAPINEPFIDIVLEANDGSGSVTRDFALLLDPPESKTSSASNIAQPTAGGSSRVRETTGADGERIVIPSSVEAQEEGAPRRKVRRRRARTHAASAAGGGTVRVRRGDTAGAIAVRNRPARVSLDQMLVALQRANSHAFINGNVNLLKSGVVLRMPSAEEVRSVSREEARSIIVAQSQDFHNYRGRLADMPVAQVPQNAQQSSGRVQPRVENERQSTVAAPDVLTVAKADVAAKQNTEQRMAEAMQQRDNTNRADELNRNLSDLKNISADVAASAQGAGNIAVENPSSVTPSMGVELPASAPDMFASQADMAASAAVGAASEAVEAASAQEPASAQEEQPKPRRKPRPAPAPVVEEPGFFESLLQNPLMLGGAGALILGGLGYMFLRRKKKGSDDELNSDFMAGDFPADSFFNTSGNRSVDTSEDDNPTTAGADATNLNQSSMLYSPSQLDADATVNPVEEADVYLAYGRDAQAEEILKDALQKQPDDIQIHVKLLEIYARRKDVATFEQAALELKRLTSGKGHDWEAICKRGAEIDPTNPLYGAAAPVATAVAAAAAPAAVVQVAPEMDATTAAPEVSLNVPDLTAPSVSAATSTFNTSNDSALDFDISSLPLDASQAVEPAPEASEQDAMATKLALAREFVNIGDKDSARAMAQEVIAHGSAELKAEAEAFLQSIA